MRDCPEKLRDAVLVARQIHRVSNELLNVIHGYSQLLRDAPGLPESAAADIAIIADACERLRHAIRRLDEVRS